MGKVQRTIVYTVHIVHVVRTVYWCTYRTYCTVHTSLLVLINKWTLAKANQTHPWPPKAIGNMCIYIFILMIVVVAITIFIWRSFFLNSRHPGPRSSELGFGSWTLAPRRLDPADHFAKSLFLRWLQAGEPFTWKWASYFVKHVPQRPG